MMSSSRRTYTLEFKQEAVLLVTQQGVSVSEAARRLGVPSTLRRTWQHAFCEAGAVSRERRASLFRGGACGEAPGRLRCAADSTGTRGTRTSVQSQDGGQ